MPNINRLFVSELERRIYQRLPFIQAVVGPRQVGKTTGVQRLTQLGLPMHYASADSPAPPDYEWIRQEWIEARAIAKSGLGILVIDEVQKITGWSEQVKILFDEERRREHPLQVIILGSASWGLQTGLSESLAGRFELIHVPHWSFSEMQTLCNWDLDTYLQFGGYPSPAPLASEPERWQRFMQDSIIEPMLSRDILSLRTVANPALFRQTLNLALSHPAQELSLEKMQGQIQERGSTSTIKGYLELLEAGFVIKSLEKYSTRTLSKKSSSPKLLPLCPALIHAFNPPSKMSDPTWRGRVFEAAIGAELCKLGYPVSYWRNRNFEVDYVIDTGTELFALEIKSNRRTHHSGLLKFKESFPHSQTLCITEEIGTEILRSLHPLELIRSLLTLR